MSLTKLSMGGNNDVINKLFPPRESLVSDIPARDGNIGKLFLLCKTTNQRLLVKLIILQEDKIILIVPYLLNTLFMLCILLYRIGNGGNKLFVFCICICIWNSVAVLTK
jgi:hypothetical protein